MTYNGAAYPCAKKDCELSPRNSIHTDPKQFGYHPYEVPVNRFPETPTLEERVVNLERRMNALDGEQP